MEKSLHNAGDTKAQRTHRELNYKSKLNLVGGRFLLALLLHLITIQRV